MSLPTTHKLGVKRRSESSKDAHGNPVTSYGTASDWLVHGIAPGASERPNDPNRDASHILWTVYAPASSSAPTEYDLVVLDGVEYAVEAHPADWTRGPWFHPTAGIVVELIKKKG